MTQLVFDIPLGLVELIVPIAASGVFLPGFFLFGYMVRRAPDPLYARTLVVTAVAFIPVTAESLVVIVGAVLHQQALAAQFSRVHQVALTWLIPCIPYYLSVALGISRRMRVMNMLLVGAGIAVAAGITIIAFAQPDLFRSVSRPHALALEIESTFGRGARGPVTTIRDLAMLVVIVYANVLILLEVLSYRATRFSVTLLAGLGTALLLAVVSILDSVGGHLPIRFPWAIAGISLFVLASMLAATWRFVDEARAVVTAHNELQTQEKRLSYLAYHDQLTGARNRKAFYEVLVGRSRSARSGASPGIALLYVDLDYFKQVNDSYGHRVGDQMLRRVTERLQSAIRQSDSLFRIGGDEFAVIVEATVDGSELSQIAHKMISSFKQPVILEGREFTVGLSIGSSIMPKHASTVEDLVRTADKALYEAKKERNAFRLYGPEMEGTTIASDEMLVQLSEAVHRDELPMHYQPVYGSAGRLEGVEALLRWQPAGIPGLNVGAVIDLAEAAGLMDRFGPLIVRTVLRETASLIRSGELGYVSVNVTPRQITTHDFASWLEEQVAEHGIAVDRLRLEVKENQIFDSSTTGIGRAMSASSNRLRFTIDDFGRGYSSFGYLRDLDVHSLKLDAGIVADIADNPVSDAFVRGLVEIVRELSFELVVKGVESETQYRCLSELGCLSFQGFHLGRPGPIAAIVQ